MIPVLAEAERSTRSAAVLVHNLNQGKRKGLSQVICGSLSLFLTAETITFQLLQRVFLFV